MSSEKQCEFQKGQEALGISPEAVIDTILFPVLLERLNQAKIDFNLASLQHENFDSRREIIIRYFELLEKSRILNDVESRVREIFNGFDLAKLLEHTGMKLVLEHEVALTLMWLNLFKDNQTILPLKYSLKWCDQRIKQEEGNLRNYKSIDQRRSNVRDGALAMISDRH